MKKQSLVLVSSLLFLWGCNSGQPAPNANVTPPPTPAPAEKPPENKEADSDILTNSPRTVPVASGLIPSTNSDERIKRINQGRNDPFSVIPPPKAVININVPPKDTKNNTQTGANGANGANGTTGTTGAKGTTGTTGTTGSKNNSLSAAGVNGSNKKVFACGDSISAVNLKNYEPEIPPPTDAQSVLVTGIINLDGENVAIIKTPEYNYSYSIREGNYIANGLVFVKNIYSDRKEPDRKEPYVVLEQYGQKVVRKVGEEPITNKKDDNIKGDFEVPFKREQLNVISNEVNGLMLTSIDNIVTKKYGGDATQPNQPPQEVIEISGYVCNVSHKSLSVTDMSFDLSTKDTNLPPLIINQPRITIQPNKKSLFKGRITNSSAFNTTEKIDFALSNWK